MELPTLFHKAAQSWCSVVANRILFPIAASAVQPHLPNDCSVHRNGKLIDESVLVGSQMITED